MLCIAAALFHKPGLTGISDLGPIPAHLATLAGGGAALAFGVALMASGLSSSSVGTYAGQVVMAGFTNWRNPLLARRALTMLPSLVILALAVNTSQALVYSQVVCPSASRSRSCRCCSSRVTAPSWATWSTAASPAPDAGRDDPHHDTERHPARPAGGLVACLKSGRSGAQLPIMAAIPSTVRTRAMRGKMWSQK